MALDLKWVAVVVCALPLLIPVFDVLLFMLSFRWVVAKLKAAQGLKSVAVGEATETHGCPRRSPKSPDTLTEATETMYDMIQDAIKEFGPKTAMVSRKFVELKKLKETDKFPTKIYDDSQIETISYEKLGKHIRNFGAGLRSLGMEPIPQLKEGQHFDTAKGPFVMVIFEDTCSLWSIALQGAISQSMTVATCYATLGRDAVIAAVNETGATTLLLNWKKAAEYAELSKEMPTLKTIIASTYEMPNGTPIPLAKPGSKIQIISSEQLLELGSKNLETYPIVPPKPHDTCVIMYTSGSTGKPKGVIMTHSQIVSGVQGMKMNVHLRSGKEVIISYLPLAHVLALQIENAILNSGGKLCYSDARQLPTAMSMFKPTLQAGVPKVFEIIQASLLKQLSKGPPIAKTIFDICFAWKSFLLSMGMDAPVTNTLFFKLISKQIFGGVLQFAVSGGGSLNEQLHNFCRVVFCCPVIQAYALTETCVGGCFQALDDVRNGVVGPPVPCVEIMLQSEAEFKDRAGLPYLYTDTRGSNGEPVLGRGEICMRGPCISTGYYKLPDKTKEEFDADGWFHTGDIGQFTADGVIQIIDRKKNIVKLKGGEYVAIEAMENAFSQSPFVQFVCALANADLDRPLAVVNTDPFYLKKWACDKNISYTSLEDLASKPETKEAVIATMKASGKEAKLTALENGIKDCCLITNVEWGLGHGMTASGKLDRAKILSMHADEIHAMYERNGVAVSMAPKK